MERRFLAEPELEETLLALEDELVHDHVQGLLSPEQSALVSQRLRPGQAAQARAFLHAVAGSAKPRWRWRWVAEVAAAVLLVGWGWNWWKAQPVAPTASFVLSAGSLRGTDAQTVLHVPPGAQAIRFELPAVSGPVALYNAADQLVWSGLANATIEASRLPDGDYEMRSPGGATYSFALTRQ